MNDPFRRHSKDQRVVRQVLGRRGVLRPEISRVSQLPINNTEVKFQIILSKVQCQLN